MSDAKSSPVVAYLASEYPAVSHTFILREVEAVRRLGLKVATFTVNRPANMEVMSEAERREAASTVVLKTFSPARIVRSQWTVLSRAPRGWLRMAFAALALCFKGPKSPIKALAYFLEAGVLLDGMARAGAVHVHVHFANPAATAAMLAVSSGLAGMSLSAHGPDEFSNVERDMLAEKVKASAFVRCISHFCKSQVMRHTPYAQWGKLHVVRCGVDPERFPVRAEPKNPEPVVLCLGRLAPAKAQHLLIEALALLRDRNVAFRAVFAGGGPDRNSLEDLARRLGLDSRIEFTGPLGQKEVPAQYLRADVFALPSFAEGLPVVLMEAMSMGVACLATRIAGIPELVRSGENGLLVPAGDVEALAEGLGALLTDPRLRRRLGDEARAAVTAEYDLEVNCRAMAVLLIRHAREQAA